MSNSAVVTVPKSFHWAAVATLIVVIAVGGCAARKAAEQGLATCKDDLSSCKFTSERLKDQHRRCQERAVAPPTTDPYMNQWRTTFAAAAVRTSSMFRTYTYNMEIVDGALLFSLPLDVLFPEKKSKLTSGGREVVTRLSQIIKEFPGRKVMIACRSVDYQIENVKAAVALDRSLSLRRSEAIASKLGKLGIEQRTLVIGGAPGESDQTVGQFDFSLYPLPNEMPAYPSDVLPETTHSTGFSPSSQATEGW